MRVKDLIRRSALVALASAMALTALPSSALAQPQGQQGQWRNQGDRIVQSQNPRGRERAQRPVASRSSASRSAGRVEQRRDRSPRQNVRQAARPDNRDAARSEPNRNRSRVDQNRNISRNDRNRQNWRGNERSQAERTRQDWRNNDRNRAERNRATPGREAWQRNDRNRNPASWSNRNNRSNWNNRPAWRDNERQRDARRDYRQAQQRWDRAWRNNRRYDWSRHRAQNRTLFRIGVYNAPYRNYSYRRVNIGFRLDALFFGNRYWINDPWQYRLPAVHGSYRWVRYYDDVLLVDTYTGEVVDVIHDFFW